MAGDLVVTRTSSVAHLRENIAEAGLSLPGGELAELNGIG